jgi:hypothetical protein
MHYYLLLRGGERGYGGIGSLEALRPTSPISVRVAAGVGLIHNLGFDRLASLP